MIETFILVDIFSIWNGVVDKMLKVLILVQRKIIKSLKWIIITGRRLSFILMLESREKKFHSTLRIHLYQSSW
jgi:hypothetical protein